MSINFTDHQSVIDYIEKNKANFSKLNKPDQLEIIDDLLIACGRFGLENNMVEELTSGGLTDMKISEMDKEELEKLLKDATSDRKELTEAVNKAQATVSEKETEITKLIDENKSVVSNLEAARNTIKELEEKYVKAEETNKSLATQVENFTADIKYTARLNKLSEAKIDISKFDDEKKNFVKSCTDEVFDNFIAMFALKSVEIAPVKKEDAPKSDLANASEEINTITTDPDKDKVTDKIDVTFVRQGLRNKTWRS